MRVVHSLSVPHFKTEFRTCSTFLSKTVQGERRAQSHCTTFLSGGSGGACRASSLLACMMQILSLRVAAHLAPG
ncbi:hypothetical protein E2C01_070587 [Portunus trituberculatus]|uniref:Uncharacterized protein n=1 Tax=Portunus trituberculatus TaxID=210409 RepID=A0A5B7HT42_PORTR|nr:hypothetical protein [Portunus trituberculatus]